MFFFFSSRRRHTRSDRDWSSDVCSSDLALEQCDSTSGANSATCNGSGADRKSVVLGKSVDLGGRRIIKKKKKKNEREREKEKRENKKKKKKKKKYIMM